MEKRAAAERFEDLTVWQNIAEGFGRRGRSDEARLMNVAQGSLEKLKYS